MADPRDVAKVAEVLRRLPLHDAGKPKNAFDDADEIAEAAINAMAELPQRAKEVRATRNG